MATPTDLNKLEHWPELHGTMALLHPLQGIPAWVKSHSRSTKAPSLQGIYLKRWTGVTRAVRAVQRPCKHDSGATKSRSILRVPCFHTHILLHMFSEFVLGGMEAD